MKDYLVILGRECLNITFDLLDFNKLNLAGIVIDDGDKLDLRVNNERILGYNFAQLNSLIQSDNDPQNTRYLLLGYSLKYHAKEMRDAMVSMGAIKKNIHNFAPVVFTHCTKHLKYALESEAPLDFFVSGISYAEQGIDLKQIKNLGGGGANLAFSGQDLHYGFEIAKLVFSRRKVKFVLINLADYIFSYDISLAFSNHRLAWSYRAYGIDFDEDFPDKDLITLLNSSYFDVYKNTPMDTEKERLMPLNPQIIPMGVETYMAYKQVAELNRPVYPKTMAKNKKILAEYIDLCKANNAKPILFTLPYTTLIQNNLKKENHKVFLKNLNDVLKNHHADFIDLFYEKLDDTCFRDLTHLNPIGAEIMSTKLNSIISTLL